jgi:FkbM family methyltransferase
MMGLPKLIKSLLPENNLKRHLRVAYHNARLLRPVYSFTNNIYGSRFNGHLIHTLDQPFLFIEGLSRYLHHRPIRQGDVIIDAGAYHGIFSLAFASLTGRKGKVIAIEPDSTNLIGLRSNLSLNPQIKNIQVDEHILWGSTGEVRFLETGTIASSSFFTPESPAYARPSISIDDLVGALQPPSIDFIKMDIEGAEIFALQGAKATLEKYAPALAVASYHFVDGERTFPKVEFVLAEFGYRAETVWWGKECITFGWKNSQ